MVLVFEQSILFRSKCMRGLTFWTEKSGEHINEKDLKKHKYDVFRLFADCYSGKQS